MNERHHSCSEVDVSLVDLRDQLKRVSRSEGCLVCGSGQNEDRILLCDGCDRETHMYCIRPPLDSVPEGKWFCEYCSPYGSEVSLLAHFDNLRSHRAFIKPRSVRAYEAYLDAISFPLHSWVPLGSPRPRSEVTEEYVAAGRKVSVWSDVDRRYHMGRVVETRVRPGFEVTEAFVHFKSGLDARKRAVAEWLDLNESNCMIGAEVGWLCTETFSGAAQRFLRSSACLAASALCADGTAGGDQRGDGSALFYVFCEGKYLHSTCSLQPWPMELLEESAVLGRAMAQAEELEARRWRRMLELSAEDRRTLIGAMDSEALPGDLSWMDDCADEVLLGTHAAHILDQAACTLAARGLSLLGAPVLPPADSAAFLVDDAAAEGAEGGGLGWRYARRTAAKAPCDRPVGFRGRLVDLGVHWVMRQALRVVRRRDQRELRRWKMGLRSRWLRRFHLLARPYKRGLHRRRFRAVCLPSEIRTDRAAVGQAWLLRDAR